MAKKSNKSKKQKIFIEPLEQRIMLDGAGASTFLDLIDESSQSDNSNKSTHEVKKFKEIKSEDGSKELPFTNVPRDQLKRKQIVFIDKQVPDYEKLAKSFRKNVEIHFIETNEDGFKKIEQTLENGKKYSAIHIIGHGSAGQILFGNALLTNESIENYKSTLSNIGESLTQKGDILFYGCNIAANDKGEALLKKISNITKADIAASDDLTGKGGDWELEKKIGIIETRNVQVVDYNDDLLQTGIFSINSNTVEKPNATNFTASGQKASGKFIVTLEKENITFSHKITQSSSTNLAFSTRPPVDKLYITNTSGGYQVSSSNPVNSYLFFLNDKTSARKSGQAGSITFESDHQIVGVFAQGFKTVANTTYSKSGATYQAFMDTEVTNRGRDVETSSNGNNYAGVLDSVTSKHKRGRLGDWWEVTNGNRTITFGATNATPGDFIRIITKAPAQENNAPTTDGDSGSVNENSFNVTQNLMNHSSDADDDTLYVSSFDYVDDDGNTTSHTSVPSTAENTWKGVGTKYGIFRILNGTNGPHWNFLAAYPASTNYDADMGSWLSNYSSIGATETQWNNVNALDPGETVTETINYTIADGNGGEATGTITITVTGQNDTPIAVDDVNSVNEGATISTRGNPTRDGVVANDTDVDGDDTVSTFTVNKIKAGYGEHLINRASPVMDPTTVFGTYGTLYMYSDGSYTYSANSEIAGLEEGETVNDVFTYAIKDNSNESELGNTGNTSDYVPDDKNSIGTLTITINGIGSVNNAPVATDDYDSVAEDATITRSSTASGTSNLIVDDTDADGDDISVVNVRVYTAPDPFSSAPAWNSVSAGSDYNTNYREITGTYGTLRVGANGTYRYVADQDAADPLDPENPDFEYDTFEIQISDTEATSTSILKIYVTGVNDTPVGVDNTDAVTYGSTLSRSNGSIYDILTNDTDIDGDDNSSNFSVTSITPDGGSAQTTFTGNTESVTGSYGVLVLNSNGSYTYTPNDTTSRNLANGAKANDVFTYTVSDDSGGTHTTATLTIIVTGKTPNPLNDTAYVAAGGSLSITNGSSGVDPGGDGVNADGDHSGDVLENDSGTSNTVTAIENSDSETGTIGSVISGIYGDLTINEDGSYTYEANNASSIGDTTATDVFTYTVTDGATGTTATATITITVEGTDDAPTATNDTGYIYENSTLNVTTDSEGAGEFGNDDDNNNESGDFSGNVMGNDQDPEGSNITVTAIRHSEDASADATSITASTTYSNGSSILGDYGVLTIGADGSYTYNANTANALDDGDTATDVFTYTVSDGSLTDTGTLTITIEGINDAPVAQDDFGFIDENSTLEVTATADATTDNVYATNTGPITSGAISITNPGPLASTTNGDTYSEDLEFNSDGTYVYVGGKRHDLVFKYGLTTAYDFSTIDTVAYDASTNTDGYQKLDPSINNLTGISAKPDGTKIFVTGWSGSDYIIKQFSLSTANNLATADTDAYDASNNTDGYKEYTFSDITTTNDNKDAQHSLIFSSDGTKLFTFEVVNGNDKLHQYSLTTAWDIGSMNHDGSITLQSDVYDPLGLTSDIHTPRGMAFNDDGTKLTILSDLGTDKLYQFSLNSAYNINDPVTLEGERSLSGTSNIRGLAFNSDGTELTILQHDGNNIDYHQLNLTGTAYEIGKYKETGTTEQSTGNVIDTQSSTHYDNDADDASSLTISAIRTGTEAAGTGTSGTVGSSLTGTYGTLTIQPSGAYTYVANLAATEALDAGDVAIDYFTYTLSDGTATDTAQLTIKVTGVNDAPSAANDTGYIAEGSTLTVSDGGAAVSGTSTGSNSGDLLDNDTDVDVTADSSGNVTENSDDALTVTVGGTVTQNGGTDSSGDAVDANGQAATVGSAVTGLYGSLTINSVGSYSYVANNAEALDVGETVTDIFTFPVTDSQGSATTATLTITVIGVNDLPASADRTVYINENNVDTSYSTRTSTNITKTFASSDFAFTDTDTSDSSISAIKIVTLPSSGTLTLSGSAVTAGDEIAVASISSLVYTPTANSESDDSFTFKVSDGTVFSAEANTISISNNAAPVATDRTHSTAIAPSATTETYNLYSSHVADSDDADSDLTITGVASGSESSTIPDGNVGSSVSGSYGTLTLNSDGTYSYEASGTNSIAAGQTDTDVFNYTVKDNETNSGSNALDVGQLTFTVSSSTTDPVPADDTGRIQAGSGSTLTVTDDHPGTDADSNGNFDEVSGDNTGDVLTNDTIYLLGGTKSVTAISHSNGNDDVVDAGSTYSQSGGQPGSIVGTYGTITIGADGSYKYVPNSVADALSAGDLATDIFTYTMTDGSETATANITITVLGVNDAPTVTSDLKVYLNERNRETDHGIRTTDNTRYTFTGNDFSQIFNDVDGDDLDRVRLITNTANDDLVNRNDNDTAIKTGSNAVGEEDIFHSLTSGEFRMKFKPANNAFNNTTFTYKVGDGSNYSSADYTGYININAAPLASDTSVAGTVAAGADSSSNIITDGVTDADDAAGNLRITGVAAGEEDATVPDGSVGVRIDGSYGYLVLDQDGSYTYTANATNNITYGGTAEDKFNYTVKDNEISDDHNTVLSGDQNAGSDALDVGEIIFTVAAHTNVAPTSADKTVYVNENNTTLTPGEDPASLSSGDRTPSANLIKTFAASDFAFTDTNTGQTLKSIQIVDLPLNGSLAVSGSAVSALDTIEYNNIQNLVYTPSVNSESNDSFTFKVIDTADEASANPYTMTIVNNAAPDVTNISASSIAAGGTSTGDVHDSVADADDVDSDLVVTGLKTGSEASNSSAIITDGTGVAGPGVDGSYGTLVIAADGTYTYTADATNDISYGSTGTDTFTFTTRDDETNTDANYAYDAGQITFRVGSSISLNTDTDTVNEDGIINTLEEGVDGVIDNDAADTDGLLVATVTSNNTSATNAAGSAVIGQYGILTLQPDGSYIYDTSLIAATDALTAGQQVADVFTYVADGGATSTLTITVTGLGPLAVADTADVNENATVTGDGYSDDTTNDGVIENDDDGGTSYESEHSSLRVTRVSTDNFSSDIETVADNDDGQTIDGTYGTLTIYRDGEYSYTPDSAAAEALDDGASATETFYYEIKDDEDVNASTTTLTFNITGVNDVIVAIDDEDEVDEGSNVLRGNTSAYSLDYDDLDVDTADTYSTHEITVIRTKNEAALDGTYGTIATPLEGDYGRLTVFADGSYNYQANNNIMISGSRMVSGQSVTDVFTYTVADGNGSTDTAILTITINGTDEPPIAEDDYTTVNVEDGSVTVNSGNGVSVNDADIEGDITVTGIENSSGNTGTIGSPLSGNYGNLVLNTDGSYTYTIDTSNTEINKIPEGGSFIEEFTYTITDEAGQTTTATIFIKINGKNDAPEAVDDTDELDLNTTTSVSRDLGSDYVVTSDDNDIDLNDYVYIQSFRTGQSSVSGTSGTLNSSLSGTYGSLNLSTDGTYTYVSNSGLVDTLDPGQSVYDYFTYTISDSQGATAYAQLTIRLYGPEAETETETETEIDHRDLDSSFRNLVQRASLTGKDPYELPEIIPSLSTNFYEGQFKIATFSENLKLVDLRAQFKDKDGNYTTFSDGSPDDILVLQFSVFNDPGIELVRYKGEMKDGSALPSWIKVNPKSGVVVTEIPPDVDLLEFKVIGIDEKNNEYEIAVVIDAGELRQNRELAKEFAGEIDENISVNEDGDVEVQSDEEQTNNETENKSLNGNEVKIKSKKQINEFVKGDVFKPKPYLRDNKYIINLPYEIKDNLEKGIAVLRNGEKAPKWVKVSLGKGELVLDPPKNLKNLNLTIVTMDQEGNKISNEIKSKINKRSAERFAKQVEIKEQSKFVSLNDQVGNEKIQFDNYGEDILSRL